MKREKENKENKEILISFRLTASEYEAISIKLQKSTLSRSEFFREVFLRQTYIFNLKEKKPPEYKNLLFIFNKASNNLNQIAKRVNSDNKSGVVSNTTYLKTINQLISINNYLKFRL